MSKQVENFEIVLSEHEGVNLLIVTFDLDDVKDIPRKLGSVSFSKDKKCFNMTFEDSSSWMNVEFPGIPEDLAKEVNGYDLVTVACLNSEGVVFSNSLKMDKV